MIDVVEGGLRFRHPLIRSAVRQSARSRHRHSRHTRHWPTSSRSRAPALASRDASPSGPTRRSRGALERPRGCGAPPRRGDGGRRRRSSGRPISRPIQQRKGERLVRAAELAYELGDVESSAASSSRAEALELDSLEAARTRWLQQMISGDVWSRAGAAKTFVTIAKQMPRAGDADMALRSLVPIAHRCWWTPSRTRTRAVPRRHGREHRDVPTTTREFWRSWPSLIRRRRGRSSGAGSRREQAARSDRSRRRDVRRNRRREVGRLRLAAPLPRASGRGLREQGRLGLLTQALVHYAWAAMHTGDWEAAAAAVWRRQAGARYPPTAVRAHGRADRGASSPAPAGTTTRSRS